MVSMGVETITFALLDMAIAILVAQAKVMDSTPILTNTFCLLAFGWLFQYVLP